MIIIKYRRELERVHEKKAKDYLEGIGLLEKKRSVAEQKTISSKRLFCDNYSEFDEDDLLRLNLWIKEDIRSCL